MYIHPKRQCASQQLPLFLGSLLRLRLRRSHRDLLDSVGAQRLEIAHGDGGRNVFFAALRCLVWVVFKSFKPLG